MRSERAVTPQISRLTLLSSTAIGDYMLTTKDKPTKNSRYILPALITIILLDFALSFFAAPTWAFVVLFVGTLTVIGWVVWTLFTHRLPEFEYIVAAIVLFSTLRSTMATLNFPDWWNTVWLLALITLGIWTVRYVVREWNRTQDK